MYEFLILPIVASLIAQGSKFFIKSNKQKFSFANIFVYSGMPSGHTAMVISLCTITGLKLGWSSPIFAFSVVFAILIIKDAISLRRYLGQHGKTLNLLVKDLEEDELLDEYYPHHLEKIGHTPAQALAGGVIGFIVSFIGYYIL